MKQRKLKKWVVITLRVILVLSFVIMASDCENTMLFFISHVIAGLLFGLSAYVLIRKEN